VEKLDITRTQWLKEGTTQDLACTVTKLSEGKQYLFRVSAENQYGVSDPAEIPEPVTAKNPYSKWFKKTLELVV
jgi:titin